jgi:phosphoglycolate phosphatase
VRRFILFDIDGTLVWGGPAKGAFCEAMVETYGTVGDIENVSFGGKTDPQIVRELLEGHGFARDQIRAGLPALFEGYTSRLEARLGDDPVTVLPGVHALLDALAEVDDIGVALLTGNIVRGAQLKLDSAGLWERFTLGSYGSDHEERDELPAIALERARATWRESLTPRDAIVVGDTPSDVSCGQAGGTRTLAVATGNYSFEDLSRTGADHVIGDLSDTDHVLSLLTQ